jgi:hypothetical protein
MDNQLKEFEELFIDNALLKVYNQTWRIKPKMEGMMANGIGNYKRTYPKQFGDSSWK